MNAVLGLGVGLAIGSLPTADWLARLAGVDLRRDGSGNPGANNALRLGGARLGAAVLGVEIVKGVLVVAIAGLLWTDSAVLPAGIGAIAGNVFNPWYRFRGGKGLAITAGVTFGAWPTVIPVALAAIGLGVWATRSTSKATISALVVYVSASGMWALGKWPMAWGVDPGAGLVWFAGTAALLILPKQIRDLPRPAPA